MQHKLLLVDDDELHLESAQEFLESHGYVVETARDGETAISKVKATPHRYSLVILDYRMKGKDGAATVEALTAINPDLFVLVFSGDSSRDAVLLTTRSGARGFVDKGESPETFLAEVNRWCRKFEDTHITVSAHASPTENEVRLKKLGLVGRSASFAEVATVVERLKTRTGPVLILGESGTGKELVARALHGEGLFRAVNCASFASNPQLMASTLFGHVRGAFTGATNDKKGILEEVNGGTVFLDELYALPASSQMELLRALQEKAVIPVGGTKEIPVKFRLVAAAKPSLLDDVKSGKFASDLFYRISRTIIPLSPLRERPEDIEPLVNHFSAKWSEENGEQKTFLMRTIPYLQSYPWPGNVRELENLVYSLLDLSTSAKIAPEDLEAKFFQNSKSSVTHTHIFSLKDRVDDVEKQHLISVLGVSKTLREAARRMEISLTTVLRLMKKHALQANLLSGTAGGIKESLREIKRRDRT